MTSSQLPITAPAATTSQSPAAPAAGSAAVSNDAAGVAVEASASREFVAMLAQLMGEGAEVVAAPVQATESDTEAAVTEPVCELTVPEDVVLADPAIAALLSPPVPVVSQKLAVGVPESSVAKSVVSFALPKTTAAVAKEVAEDAIESLPREALESLPDSAKDVAVRAPLAREAELAIDGLLAEGASPQLHGTAGSSGHGRPTLMVDARVGSPAWTDQLAARVSFLNERGIQSASLRLSPENLGPMEIQISVRDERATVWFGAAHAETRTALEQALPRLRELLQSQGLSLADAGVFREPPRDHSQDPSRAYRVNDSTLAGGSEDNAVVVRLNRNSLVDAYA